MASLNILIGIEFFRRVREENHCYVDKTGFIEELLSYNQAMVSLITRPRRFGKTLTMTMLQEFFDIRQDSRAIFEGLTVSKNTALCDRWMNQYPTVFITLKGVEGQSFSHTLEKMALLMQKVCLKHAYLFDESKVPIEIIENLMTLKKCRADLPVLENSLALICEALEIYWEKPVILLIDEYDTPVNCAEQKGYYDEMISFMRSFLGAALKTNTSLKFAVLTGCLRIAKESIFTGFNNFKCFGISDSCFADKFGFTHQEVKGLLDKAGLSARETELKEWYDGYRFGQEAEIYCPWDVLQYLSDVQHYAETRPQAYWNNTSSNSIVKTLINRANRGDIRNKIEKLIDGGAVEEELAEDLTYDIIYDNESNLWTILYLTGYLTKAYKQPNDDLTALIIPNKAVRKIFTTTVSKWFKETLKNQDLSSFAAALWNGEAAELEQMLTQILYSTISYFDSAENYYHGFMTGLIRGAGLSICSNDETGLGRADIVIEDGLNRRAIIIELKCARTPEELEAKAGEALKQIEERKYAQGLGWRIKKVMNYGIAFWKKESCVKVLETER
ncbi:MAG: ATP-binding protein [bacterium]|nr:ATP-binding protein [bacterium]